MISFKDLCDYFFVGKVKVMILLFFVLVVIEMFNFFNALFEDNSLVIMLLWINFWFLIVMLFLLGLYCLILYFFVLVNVFGVVFFIFDEWLIVFIVLLFVIFIDEVFKVVGRR